MQCISFLLETIGFDFDNATWRDFFEHILLIIRPPLSEELTQSIFDVIQKVKSNYLNCLSRESTSILLDVIKLFENVAESKGLRYGILEFLHSISDNISKKFGSDLGLMTKIFSFLKMGCESREADVRNTSISLFAGIISTFNDFNSELWKLLIEQNFLPVFDRSFEVYFNLIREEKGRALPDTPEYIHHIKDDFESKKEKKSAKTVPVLCEKEPEALTLQWIETLKVLIHSFHRLLTQYLLSDFKQEEIVEKFFEKTFTLFRITNKHVFNEVSPVIRTFFSSQAITISKKKTIFEEILLWLRLN